MYTYKCTYTYRERYGDISRLFICMVYIYIYREREREIDIHIYIYTHTYSLFTYTHTHTDCTHMRLVLGHEAAQAGHRVLRRVPQLKKTNQTTK